MKFNINEWVEKQTKLNEKVDHIDDKEAAANLLTNSALDPFGKIPEFKYCAAKIRSIK